jgi:hypothetical protein
MNVLFCSITVNRNLTWAGLERSPPAPTFEVEKEANRAVCTETT